MRGFDIAQKLKRSIEVADAICYGRTIDLVTLRELPEVVEIDRERFTVFRRKAGVEKPVAFGLSESEAKGFIAVAQWNARNSGPVDFVVGDPIPEFRIGEENEL